MKICSSNNNNSVKCYEYFNNKDNFVIIMELCDENLSEMLHKRLKNGERGFNTDEIYEIMNQLNYTFKIMKENNIMHRDLTLDNILIKYNDEAHKEYTVKLSGYGCSKRRSISRCNSFVGTPVYMAPEILKNENYNYKCDLWNIGIIIYRLIFGKSPYLGEREIQILKNIEKFGNKIIKKTGNEALDDLVIKLLEKDPSKRINWDEYFNHSFFKSKNTKNLIDDNLNGNTNSKINKDKDSNKDDLLALLNEEKEKTKNLTELLNAEKNKTKYLSEELKNEKKKTKYLTDELKKEKDKNKQLINECNEVKQTNLNLNNKLNQLKKGKKI